MQKSEKRAAALATGIFTSFITVASFLAFVGCAPEDGFKKISGDENLSAGAKYFAPVEEDIIIDETTGLGIIKDVISVTFKLETDQNRVDEIISSINGKIVGRDRARNFFQIQISESGPENLDLACKTLLGKFKEVELASRTAVSAHKNPYYVK